MKALLLIFAISTASTSLVSQTLRPRPELKEIVVLRIDGVRISGINGSMATSVLYFSNSGGLKDSLNFSQIRTLYVRTGTRAGTMAILGAASVGTLFLIRSLSADEQDPHSKSVSSGTVVLSCVGGAFIGALVGSSSEIWEIVPLPEQ